MVNVDERARLRTLEKWMQVPLTDDTAVTILGATFRSMASMGMGTMMSR